MSDYSMNLTRRQACSILGGALAGFALLGVSGCSKSDEDETDGTAVQGFADDTQVRSYPLTLKIIADANLQRGYESAQRLGRIEEFVSKYQSQGGRGDVSIAFKYYSAEDLASFMEEGFPEACDGVVALSDTVAAGVESETLYAGLAGISVRSFSGTLYERLTVVRAAGSSYEMPKAQTIDGEDSQDGQINKIQALPDLRGSIAVASEELAEGILANRVLAKWGLYSEESGVGGDYDDSIVDKVEVFDDLDELVLAVRTHECSLGMVTQSMLWGDYPGLESVYEVSRSDWVYDGAALTDAAEGGVARDFFEYVVRCV